MSADDPLLSCTDLRKEFAAVVAVDDVSVEVYDEFTSLIGPNGAGKTTFFNLLFGTYDPTAGEIRLKGEEVTGKKPNDRVQRGLSRTYQITNLFTELSAFENVRVAVQATSDVRYANVFRDALDLPEINERTHQILDRVGFEENRRTAAEDLSQGYKRLLEIAVALAAEPDLLLLDEPTAGLAVDKKDLVLDVIAEVGRTHAVMLIEHKLDIIRDLSDRLLVMYDGSLLAEGDPATVLAEERVQEAYLRGKGGSQR